MFFFICIYIFCFAQNFFFFISRRKYQLTVTRDEVEDSNAEENHGFNNKMKHMNNKNHPEGEKQAGRQKTGAQST